MFRWLLNFIVLIVLIGLYEISSDDPRVEQNLQSKLSDRPIEPTDPTLSSSSLNFSAQDETAMDKRLRVFYQKISQQRQSHDESSSSIVRSASPSRSTVQSKSAKSERKNMAQAAAHKKSNEFRLHPRPLHSISGPARKTNNNKTSLPSHRAKNHFKPNGLPDTRDVPRLSNRVKPGDETSTQVHPHNRFRRDTLVERRPRRQRGGLRSKTDDKSGFHFRLILGKNSTARRPHSKLIKFKHPANLHVLRKRATMLDEKSAETKHLDTESKIYSEHNEISHDFDSFAPETLWSSELAKDKLNFYENKLANGSLELTDDRGSIEDNTEEGKKEDETMIFQNGSDLGSTSSVENADQSNKEKCGNPQGFSYRYYWCRAKNVFRNLVKLLKSK